jgi:protein-S-isoprenylcysteine O-methyltransferase Ste14
MFEYITEKAKIYMLNVTQKFQRNEISAEDAIKKFRLFLLFLLLIPLFYFQDFYQHFYIYVTGNVLTNIIMQQWHVVIFFTVFFLAFLLPLSFGRKVDWVEYGLVSAFFISLFVEMYGIPLTILFASKYFFVSNINLPSNMAEVKFLGVNFSMDVVMVYGEALMVIGMFSIIVGWIKLYRNKKRGLVTNGIYSYSRHPQYLGFILIVVGWLVGWPTILTIILSPILIYKYLRLCKTEEKEISNKFSGYKKYMENVPFLL